MRKNVILNICSLLVALSCLLLLAACGGSGGGTTPPVTTTTLKGVVEFPAAAAGAGKITAKMVTEDDILVEVFDLNGKKIASVKPQYDDALATRLYAYSVPALPPNVDYVLKARKASTSQVIRKLIEKSTVVVGTVDGQKVDPVSTTAVIIAEKTLATTFGLATTAIKLGEENFVLPSSVSTGAISLTIHTNVQPSNMESRITTLVTAVAGNHLESINSQENVNLINSFNLVNEAIVQKIDAHELAAGTTTKQISVNTYTFATATAPPTISLTKVEAGAAAAAALSNLTGVYTAPPLPTTPTTTTPPATPLTAADYLIVAKAYMNKQDIANASITYEQALIADPANKDANFGSAVTKALMLIENADVKNIITKWGGVAPTVNQVISAASPVGNPFNNMTSAVTTATSAPVLAKTTAKAALTEPTAKLLLNAFVTLKGKLPQQAAVKTTAKGLALVPTTAPTVSEMQAVIDGVIIPAIKTITARLAKVEGNGYTFTVSKAMQGNPLYGADVTLGDGEFYTLDAALNGIQSILTIATAYNFNTASTDYNVVGRDPLATINSSTFFTLKADGKTKMADALTLVKNTRDKAELAYGVLKLRTSGQGAFDLTGMTAAQKADFEDVLLVKAKAALLGQQTFTSNGKSLTIDVTKFFTNPLDRTDLPTLGYDVAPNATLSVKYDTAVAGERTETFYDYNMGINKTMTMPINSEIVPKSDLPDYTLNGILPGNTIANNVAGFNGILPVLDGKLLTGVKLNYSYAFTTDGSNVYFLSMNDGLSTVAKTTGSMIYTQNYVVQKLDLATGIVTNHATLSAPGWIDGMAMTAGTLYVALNDYTTSTSQLAMSVYSVDTSTSAWNVNSTATYSAVLPQNSSPGAVAASGNEVYFTLSKWTASGYVTEMRKISSYLTDPALFTTSDHISRIAYSNGSFFTSGGGNLDKRSATGAILASYANGGMDLMANGYFYKFYDGKLIKKAGTPAGGAAKSSF
jgi:hypothetical protein